MQNESAHENDGHFAFSNLHFSFYIRRPARRVNHLSFRHCWPCYFIGCRL
jgi:hypothetical protein